MKKTDMTIVRVGKAIACQLAGTFLAVAAGLNPCVANGYENDGTISKIVGKDRIERDMLEIPGSYRSKDGVFQFIKQNKVSLYNKTRSAYIKQNGIKIWRILA